MLGSLGFLTPWALAALAALPAIWWLLRATPPQPNVVAFPPTRLLLGLKNREQTPARSPWWLTAIRMLAAAAVIFALADPILNADKKQSLGDGPLVLFIDNGWASANQWQLRKDYALRLIDDAEAQSKPVLLLPTAVTGQIITNSLKAPNTAREHIEALTPAPFAPDRMAASRTYQKLLADFRALKSASIFWLSDGLDYGHADQFGKELLRISGQTGTTTATSGRVAMVRSAEATGPLALTAQIEKAGKLSATVISAGSRGGSGTIIARAKNGQKLAETAYSFAPGKHSARALIDLPTELRNQISRLEIAGQKSAGAVHLLDARSRWNRIGLLTGASQEQAQPLLAPLYYINRALAPFAELLRSNEPNLAVALTSQLKQNPSVLIMADIGKLAGTTLKKLKDWTAQGGVLIRFAGPRLEKANDELLPVPLRFGGRTLGGALSWSTPQPLAGFDDDSPFAGLSIPREVTINRQVLADPAMLTDETLIWARLKDGTPLVTAKRRENGWLVLFHITANSDWSNLPLSGLFVEMLRRLNTLSSVSPVAGNSSDTDSGTSASASFANEVRDLLPPYKSLNGFGELNAPPSTARAISARMFSRAKPGPNHPPGLYGPPGSTRALNLITHKTRLKKLDQTVSAITTTVYETENATPLKAYALMTALTLLFADIIAVLFLQSNLRLWRRASAGTAMLMATIGLLSALTISAGSPAHAQQSNPGHDFAAKSALNTHLAYVLTGVGDVDRTSKLGLQGLSRVLARRTAVEPIDPIGVNIENDELAFFPLLYWPVVENAQSLNEATLAKVDAYMKKGGMIIFDTRDFQNAIPSADGSPSGNSKTLQRLIGKLDIPRLEPVPENHVLTKSFYLLSSFPGRWDGGELWVEARSKSPGGSTRAGRTDGVSSILITSNDFAAAWALDDRNTPLFPVVPGGELQREWAFRVGVNIVMYALTGNYKADQVHIPALLERLGQ